MNYKDVYKFPTITDKDYVLRFGKHKSKSIGELIDTEPEYLLWCVERDILDLDHKLIDKIEQCNPWIREEKAYAAVFNGGQNKA